MSTGPAASNEPAAVAHGANDCERNTEGVRSPGGRGTGRALAHRHLYLMSSEKNACVRASSAPESSDSEDMWKTPLFPPAVKDGVPPTKRRPPHAPRRVVCPPGGAAGGTRGPLTAKNRTRGGPHDGEQVATGRSWVVLRLRGIRVPFVPPCARVRRAFDHMLGVKAATNPAINGCPPTNAAPYCSNPIDPTNSSSPRVHTDAKAVDVQPSDPDHSVPGTHQQMFGTGAPEPIGAIPSMDGFIANCTLNWILSGTVRVPSRHRPHFLRCPQTPCTIPRHLAAVPSS